MGGARAGPVPPRLQQRRCRAASVQRASVACRGVLCAVQTSGARLAALVVIVQLQVFTGIELAAGQGSVDFSSRQYTHQYCLGTPNQYMSQNRHLVIDTLRPLPVSQAPVFLEDSPPDVAYGPHWNGPYTSTPNGWTPFAPGQPYSINSQPTCAWTFEAPAGVTTIVAGVTYIDLESPGDSLVFVDITDSNPTAWLAGPNPTDVNHPPALRVVTGNGTVQAIQISRPSNWPRRPKLLVYWMIDFDVQFEGWGIFVQAVSFNCRHNMTTNLNMPSNYLHGGAGYPVVTGGVTCRWVIDVTRTAGGPPDGIAFQLHNASLQQQDSLTVFDGDKESAPVLARFSGTASNVNVTTSRTRLLVVYTSTLNSTMRFNASYVRLTCPSCINGQCVNGTCACNANFTGARCNVPTRLAPLVASNWTCAIDNYGTRDGCDCGCGLHDPDCETPEPPQGWCAGGLNSYHDGTCAYCPLARPTWPVNGGGGIPSSSPTANNVLYVSPRGTDVIWCTQYPCDNGYSWNNPFRTIAKALSAVQTYLAGQGFPVNRFRIVVLPGRYTGISNRRLSYQDNSIAYLHLTLMGLSGPLYTILDAERQGWHLYMSTRLLGTSHITGLAFANARYLTRSPRTISNQGASSSPAGGAIQCGEWLLSPNQDFAGCNNVAITNCHFRNNEVIWNDAATVGSGTALFDIASLGGGDINAALGGGAVNFALGKNVTISDSLFINNKASLTISGSTDAVGAASNSTARKIHGGAVALYDITDSIAILRSNFTSSRSGAYGGAVYAVLARSPGLATTVRVEDCAFDSNSALSAGAGLMVQGAGTVIVRRTSLLNNIAQSASYADSISGGVGLWVGAGLSGFEGGSAGNRGSVTISDSLFFNNTHLPLASQVDGGGGGLLSTGMDRVTLRNVSFVQNTVASGRGGGALVINASRLLIEASSFASNAESGGTGTDGGGGLAALSVLQMALQNISFTGNSADTGGAVWVGSRSPPTERSHSANVSGCVFSENESRTGMGGALYVAATSRPAYVAVEDSIFESNRAVTNGGGVTIRGPATYAQRLNSSSASFVRTRVARNAAAANGGGFYIEGLLSFSLSDGSVISENRANTGAGLAFVTSAACRDPSAEGCPRLRARLDGVNISSNRAADGGGMSLDGSGLSLTAARSALFDNEARQLGGGLYAVDVGALALSSVSFASNAASNGGGAFITSDWPVSFKMPGVSFIGNYAEENGGGLFISGETSVELTGGQLTQNTATANGGLAYIKKSSCLALLNLTVTSNAADNGGTFFLDQRASVLAENCSFADSHAASLGGVVYAQQSSRVTFRRVRGSGNDAAQGGGIYANLGRSGLLELEGTSWDGNEAVGDAGVLYLTGTGGLQARDFVASGNRAASGAVGIVSAEADASFSGCSVFGNVATQSDGGAFVVEHLASLSLSNCNLTGNAAQLNAGAVLATGTQPSLSLVNVQATGNTAGRGGGALSITGLCAAAIVATNLSSNTAGMYGGSVFVSGAAVAFVAVPMDDNVATSGSGGAVFAEQATTSFTDVSLKGNRAGGSGGAIYLDGGSANLTGSSVVFNHALSLGGAVHLDNAAVLSVARSAVSQNVASQDGGAISANAQSRVVIEHSDLTRNEAKRNGGAVLATTTTLTVVGSDLSGSKAARDGGCVAALGSDVTVASSNLSACAAISGAGGAIHVETTSLRAEDVDMALGFAGTNGGGVSAYMADVRIRNATLRDSRSGLSGGAVYSRMTALDVEGSSLDGSRAGADGGCVYVDDGGVRLAAATLARCSAGGRGGALFASRAAVRLEACSASGASAGADGGAVASIGAPLTVSDTVFAGSKSERGSGGAIWSDGGQVSIVRSDLSQSSAGGGHGGALYVASGAAALAACDLSRSRAAGKGGAAYFKNGTAALEDVSVAGSAAGESGGGVEVEGVDAGAPCALSLARVDATDCAARGGPGGAVHASRCNLTAVDSDMRRSQAGGPAGSGGGVRTFSSLRVELRRCDLSDTQAERNGGAAALEASSFVVEDCAMDRASSARGSGGALFVDVGEGRVERVSMRDARAGEGQGGGAAHFRAASVAVVGSPMTGASAAAGSGGAVLVEGCVANFTAVDMRGSRALGRPGAGGALKAISAEVTLQACNLSDSQSRGAGGAVSADASTLTVLDSALDRGVSAEDGGGCAHVSGGSGLFSNCSLEDCRAPISYGGAVSLQNSRGPVVFQNCSLLRGRSGHVGGAVYSESSSLTLLRSPVSRSSAFAAGGCVYASQSQLTVENAAADECTAASGGGFFLDGGSASLLCVSLTKDTATAGDGGAIYATSASLHLEACTIEMCTAEGSGGDLFLTDTEIRVLNSTVLNNTAKVDGGGLRASGFSTAQGACLLRAVSGAAAPATQHTSPMRMSLRSLLQEPAPPSPAASSSMPTFTRLVRVENSALRGNAAGGDGGSLFVSGPISAELVGVTIASSFASGRGGGIYVTADSFSMLGSTMTANRASVGGAGYMDLSKPTGEPMDCSAVSLNGTAVRGNEAAKGAAFVVKDADPTRCAAFADPRAFDGNGNGNRSIVAGPGAIAVRLLTNETNRASGELLSFHVVLTDSFGAKVVDSPTAVSLAAADPDAVSLRGALSATTLDGEATITAQIVAQPGEAHALRFTADIPYRPVTLELPVRLRPCLKGEVQLPNTRVCMRCPAGTFSILESGFKDQECRPCSDGAECPGGSAVYPSRGYQRAPYDFTVMLPCQNDACLGGPEDRCAPGHEGPLCTICAEGHGRRDKYGCASCPGRALNAALLVLTCVVALVVVAVLVAFNLRSLRPNATKRPSRLTTITKILFSYIQLLSVARDFNLRWPSELRAVFLVQTIIASPADMIVSFECFMESRVSRSAFLSRVFGYTLLPLIAVAAPALVFALAYAYHRANRPESLPRRAARSFRRLRIRGAGGRARVGPEADAGADDRDAPSPAQPAPDPEDEEEEDEEEAGEEREAPRASRSAWTASNVNYSSDSRPASRGSGSGSGSNSVRGSAALALALAAGKQREAGAAAPARAPASQSDPPPALAFAFPEQFPLEFDVAVLDASTARPAVVSLGGDSPSGSTRSRGSRSRSRSASTPELASILFAPSSGADLPATAPPLPLNARAGPVDVPLLVSPPSSSRSPRPSSLAPGSSLLAPYSSAAGYDREPPKPRRGSAPFSSPSLSESALSGRGRPPARRALGSPSASASAPDGDLGIGPGLAATLTHDADAASRSHRNLEDLLSDEGETATAVADAAGDREAGGQLQDGGRGAYLFDLFVLSSVVGLFLVHPIVSRQVFMIFACTNVGRNSLLDQDMRVGCWGAEHALWSATLGLGGVLLFVVGIPFAGLALLTANRGRLAERRVLLRYGFLLRGYRRRRFFWEAVVVLRKLAFVFVASFFSSRPVVQGLLGTGILVAALILNIVMRPYSLELLNVLDSAALLASALTLYAGLFFYSQEVAGADSAAVTVILLGINVVFCAFWVACLAYELHKKAKQQFPDAPVLLFADAVGRRLSAISYVRDWLAATDDNDNEIEVKGDAGSPPPAAAPPAIASPLGLPYASKPRPTVQGKGNAANSKAAAHGDADAGAADADADAHGHGHVAGAVVAELDACSEAHLRVRAPPPRGAGAGAAPAEIVDLRLQA